MDIKRIIGFTILAIAGIMLIVSSIECNQEQAKKIPNPPAAARIIRNTSKQIQIAWQDKAGNERGYRVYRDGVMIAELAQDSESYIDYNVQQSTLYSYEIAAFNDNGESPKIALIIKSNNPPMVIRLDKIAVGDNGEDFLRELIDGHGEIYIGVLVKDGTNPPQALRLPIKGYYNLADNDELTLVGGELLYSSSAVGEYLNIEIIGFEHDFLGKGNALLEEALNQAVTSSMGTLPSIMLTIANVDFKKEISEIAGLRDDFLGDHNIEWGASDNWGIGVPHQYNLDKGNGQKGLCIWYTIYSP